MGYGKYNREERKIVHKISDMMTKVSYHNRKTIELKGKLNDLIDKLSGKYEQKK